MSRKRINSLALVVFSALAGGALTISLQALGNKEIASSPLPVEELRTFAEVFGRVKQDYVAPVEDKKLIIDAIKGMVSSLDPHSDYLDAQAYKELREGTQGEFGGLGIEIGMEDGLLKVISPIDDTPAFKAGIKSGDLIAKVDDTPVRGLSPNEAVRRMRGKPGTKVTLTLLRKNEPKPIVVTVTRAIIKVKSVKASLLEPGYGYIRISQFQEHTVENMADMLAKLYKENKQPLKGLILDLRGNPGGLLTSAVGVAAAFLPKDTLVVYTEGRAPDSKMRLTANLANYTGPNRSNPLARLPAEAYTVPLIVLVNVGSASASEIVAGALQDNKRAVVVGTQTFGKGSVQSVLPLGSSAGIKLTTAHYFTPSGRSIQAKGIVPDVVVEEATLTSADKALAIREVDLDHHLQNPKAESGSSTPKVEAKKTASPPATPISIVPEAKQGSNDTDNSNGARNLPNLKTDYQLMQALNILKVQRILLKQKE